MATRVLQINIGRSRQALDLAIHNANEQNADIVCITEPYTYKGKAVGYPGWKSIANENSAILIRRGINNCQPINNSHRYTIGVTLEDVCITSTYAPPNTAVQPVLRELGEYKRTCQKWLANGDFNCRTAQTSTQAPRTRDVAFEEFIDSAELAIKNNEVPTLVHQGRETINDYVLARQVVVTDIRVLANEESLSDHRYLVYVVGVGAGRETVYIKTLNVKRLREELSQDALPLEQYINSDSCHTNARKITDRLEQQVRICTTLKARTSKEQWWNEQLQDLKKKLKKLRRAHHRTRNPAIQSSLKQKIDADKKRLKNMIKKAKEEAWRRFVTKQTPWGRPYKIIFKSKTNEDKQLSDEELLKRSPAVHEEETVGYCGTELLNPQNESPHYKEITRDEVSNYIRSSKNRSAPGLDTINYKTIKTYNIVKPDTLTNLYDACLRHGVFPDCWKKAKIIWIPKPGKDLQLANGYRPISLIPCLGKILEKCLHARLAEHMAGRLSERQFGFTKGKSTEDAVHNLLRDIRDGRATHSYTAVVCLDIKAAFDTVDWCYIQEQLVVYKVPYLLRKMVSSYFDKRVAVSGSATLQVRRGCPQGSVLGPLLWNLAYNRVLMEMEKSTEGALLTCYADDTAVVVSAQTTDMLKIKLYRNLRKITRLLRDAGLTLNVGKTELMILSNFTPIGFGLTFEGQRIQPKTALKYLGITVDNKLTFDQHIEHVIQKSYIILPKIISIAHNTYGYSNAARRIMLHGTIGAYVGYASTVIITAMMRPRNRQKLEALHRKMCICCGRLYRTVGYYPATVIAGYPPLALTLTADTIRRARKKNYTIVDKEHSLPVQAEDNEEQQFSKAALKKKVLGLWNDRYITANAGQWTRSLIPTVDTAVPEPDFWSAQALSGHGCFRAYLYKFKRVDSPLCECGTPETPRHVFQECPQFEEGRPAVLDLSDGSVNYMRSVVKRLWDLERARARPPTLPTEVEEDDEEDSL